MVLRRKGNGPEGGRGKAGRQARGVSGCGGRRRAAWGGVQHAEALPCPPAFGLSGRVRSVDCRPLPLSSRVPWCCAPTRGGAPARQRPRRGAGGGGWSRAARGERPRSSAGQLGESRAALQRADDTLCVTGAPTAGQPVVVGKSRSRPKAWPFGSWAARMSRSSRVSTRHPGHARKWSRQDDLRPDLVLIESPEKMRSRLEGAHHCFSHRRASPPSRRRHGGLSAKRQGP